MMISYFYVANELFESLKYKRIYLRLKGQTKHTCTCDEHRISKRNLQKYDII
jgi:hypothetical protein